MNYILLIRILLANNEPSTNLNDDGVNDENDVEDEEEDMAALLGFSSFGSTKVNIWFFSFFFE